MDASIIIASYQSRDTILQCLESVFNQTTEYEYEVIVVHSPADGTDEFIRPHFPQVTVLQQGERTYPAQARNIGVQRCQGDLIVFIDSDCRAGPQWLQRMIDRQRDSQAAVGGAIHNGEASLVSWAEYLMEFSEFSPLSPQRYVRTIPTCNISYKKERFLHYGMLPENPWAHDAKFNWKLVEHGEKILFDPGIQISHHHVRRFKDFIRHQAVLGEDFSRSRRETTLPGGLFAKHPVLIPLLFFARHLLIAQRVVKWHRPYIVQYLKSLPCLTLGLGSWCYGALRFFFSPKEST